MTTITLSYPTKFSSGRTLALGVMVLLHLVLAIGLVRALDHPATTPISAPLPVSVPTPPVVRPMAPAAHSALVSVQLQPVPVAAPTPPASALIENDAPEPGLNRLTASDLFRAERQEICERRLILGDKWLTGFALMRVAHQDAYEQALAWGMMDFPAHEQWLTQTLNPDSRCQDQ